MGHSINKVFLPLNGKPIIVYAMETFEHCSLVDEIILVAAAGEEEQMAKLSQRVRQQRTPKYKTRGYTRCRRCGRARAVYRKFGICRICLRELAHNGYIPGMTKSSW